VIIDEDVSTRVPKLVNKKDIKVSNEEGDVRDQGKEWLSKVGGYYKVAQFIEVLWVCPEAVELNVVFVPLQLS
jgi:hypothetical protein